MLEQLGLLGKSPGKPLGRLSLMEHPERKSPLSSVPGNLRPGPRGSCLLWQTGSPFRALGGTAESGPEHGEGGEGGGGGALSRSLLWLGRRWSADFILAGEND